ncbi:hypothetical protein BHE74_00038791 [Ensete ventricosum]|nr:hypothetical protein BHE74_00038791 [Ensete ventricosum]
MEDRVRKSCGCRVVEPEAVSAKKSGLCSKSLRAFQYFDLKPFFPLVSDTAVLSTPQAHSAYVPSPTPTPSSPHHASISRVPPDLPRVAPVLDPNVAASPPPGPDLDLVGRPRAWISSAQFGEPRFGFWGLGGLLLALSELILAVGASIRWKKSKRTIPI